ncbi:hypothetical protein [Anaplasma phagocytophilum]|nr:hypothetical protein [Anaplasma phagocytophilum]
MQYWSCISHCKRETSAELMAMLAELGETAYVIGEVIPRSEKPVVLR